MAKRKPTAANQESTLPAPDNGPPAAGMAGPPQDTAASPQATAVRAPEIPQPPGEGAAPPAEAASYTAVAAPPQGQGRSWTADNRVGYRKEDSPDGKRRQIRFADRPDGGKPDDELLEPVRKQKPHVTWSARERAWQARKTPDGLEAIDTADQELAEIGRRRTPGSPER